MGGHHYDENDDVSTDAHEQNSMNPMMEIKSNEELGQVSRLLLSFYQLSLRSSDPSPDRKDTH